MIFYHTWGSKLIWNVHMMPILRTQSSHLLIICFAEFWVLVVLFSFRCNEQGHFWQDKWMKFWFYFIFFFLGINLMKGFLFTVSKSATCLILQIHRTMRAQLPRKWSGDIRRHRFCHHSGICWSCWPIPHADTV